MRVGSLGWCCNGRLQRSIVAAKHRPPLQRSTISACVRTLVRGDFCFALWSGLQRSLALSTHLFGIYTFFVFSLTMRINSLALSSVFFRSFIATLISCLTSTCFSSHDCRTGIVASSCSGFQHTWLSSGTAALKLDHVATAIARVPKNIPLFVLHPSLLHT